MGNNRIVFRMNKYVFKFPINDKGERDNDWEGSCTSLGTSKYDVKIPKTRFVTYKGFVCCMMEYVEPYNGPLKELPDWVYSVDCVQVGYTGNGRLVAYDFATG